ncbi:hypothetical protein GPECTOR_229g514 [Gonium pectorale]|uniref:Uncharacterized protein n=1 Tax=Gonium pectorale TaxID=33097 RepID=A0A150FWN8_GONPE|nr:hypothetical protein GPECTOR_229g514 [Gonium pectorale]|eukprot:KXZ41988.1 hypothetical protein GPECTOR_229g514 [Gonium pectorale]
MDALRALENRFKFHATCVRNLGSTATVGLSAAYEMFRSKRHLFTTSDFNPEAFDKAAGDSLVASLRAARQSANSGYTTQQDQPRTNYQWRRDDKRSDDSRPRR